jgi:hypothetical protein
MSDAEKLAEQHGVSKMAVSKWKRAGLLKFTESGDLDANSTDESLRDAGKGKYRYRAAADAGAGADGGDELTLAEASRRHAVAVARARVAAF